MISYLERSFSEDDGESLWSVFESCIGTLPGNMHILCVIDGLQASCDRQKRQRDVDRFVPRLIKLAWLSQAVRCRFKHLLTASMKACNIDAGDVQHIGDQALDLQGLKDRFGADNKLRWA